MMRQSIVLIAVFVFIGQTSIPTLINRQSRVLSTGQPSGELRGTLMAVDGAVIPQAVVTFAGEGVIRKGLTNDYGIYEVEVPAGIYRIQIEAPGFCPMRRASFRVRSSAVITFD